MRSSLQESGKRHGAQLENVLSILFSTTNPGNPILLCNLIHCAVESHVTCHSLEGNKIREPNDWKPMCSSYIKSNNISVLAMFQGLI